MSSEEEPRQVKVLMRAVNSGRHRYFEMVLSSKACGARVLYRDFNLDLGVGSLWRGTGAYIGSF